MEGVEERLAKLAAEVLNTAPEQAAVPDAVAGAAMTWWSRRRVSGTRPRHVRDMSPPGAAIGGDGAAVRAWLARAGQVDATWESGSVRGISLLMIAARRGEESAVQLLLLARGRARRVEIARD